MGSKPKCPFYFIAFIVLKRFLNQEMYQHQEADK